MFFDLKQSSGLLFVGLFVSSITGCSATHTLEVAATAGEPKIVEESIALSPSVSARVTKIQFFEGERSKRAFTAERNYETRFATKMTRTVYTEVHLDYPRPETNIYFPITLYFRQNGRTLRIEEFENRIRPDWTSSSHVIGAGDFDPGKWPVGNYELDVYINAKKAATGYFEIY
ncbi:MAG: hypothetical protein ACREQ2_04160 [Candidatus Binatia bacterium]